MNTHTGTPRYTVCPNKKETPFVSDIFIATQGLIKHASLSRAFSLLSFDTKKRMMISQFMTEKEQFRLMHVKINLHRIMVLSWYDHFQTS